MVVIVIKSSIASLSTYYVLVRASQVLSGKESAWQCRKHRFWSLNWEDPLEKERAIHSCILAWEIPWMEEPGGLQSMGLQKGETQLSV